MPKERAPGLTSVSISITVDALAKIDARAAKLGLTRSGYLSLFATQEPPNVSGLPAPLPPDASSVPPFPADSQPAPALPNPVPRPQSLNFTSEVYDFLLIAIPALRAYKASKDRGDTDPGDSLTVEIPPDIAESKLWRFFYLEREEILDLKWIESEKAKRDIGFNQAILIWLQLHRPLWAPAHKPED